MEESGASAIGLHSKLPNGLVEGDPAELRSPTSLRRGLSHTLSTSAALKLTLANHHPPFTTLASQNEVKEIPNTISSSYNNNGPDSIDLGKRGWSSDLRDNAAHFGTSDISTVRDSCASTGVAPPKQRSSPGTLLSQDSLLTSTAAVGAHGSGGMHYNSQPQSKNSSTSNLNNDVWQNHHQLCQTSSGCVETRRPSSSSQRVIGYPSPQSQIGVVHHHYRYQKHHKHHYHQYQEYYHHHHHHHHFYQHPMGTQGASAPAMLYEEFGNYPHRQQQQMLYCQNISQLPMQNYHRHQYHHRQHQQFTGVSSGYLSHPEYTDPFYAPAAPIVSAKPSFNTNCYADPRGMVSSETYYQPPYYHFPNYPSQEVMLTAASTTPQNCEDSSSAGGFIGGINSSNVNPASYFHFPAVVPPAAALPSANVQLRGYRPFYSQGYGMHPTPPPINNSMQPYPRDYHLGQPEFNAMQQGGVSPYLLQNHSQMMQFSGGGAYMSFPCRSILGRKTSTNGGYVSDTPVVAGPNKSDLKKNYDNAEGSEAYTSHKRSREMEMNIRDANSEDRHSTNGLSAMTLKGDRCVNMSVPTVDVDSISNYQNSPFQQHLHGHRHKEAYLYQHRATHNGSDLREAPAEAREDTPPSVSEISYDRQSGPTRSVSMASNFIQNHPRVDTTVQVAELPNCKLPPALHGKTAPGAVATHPLNEVSLSTTPTGAVHYEEQLARDIKSHSSQHQQPFVPISTGLEIATEEGVRPQDQPPNLVTEPQFVIASNSPSGHLAGVNLERWDTEGGSKPATANTTPVRHPPCYTNAMDRYWNSFSPAQALTLDSSAFPTSTSASTPQGLPINYESSMHPPPSSHQSPAMYGAGGVRTFKPNSSYSHLNTLHSYREEMGISRQACGHHPKMGPGAVPTMVSAPALSQPPPFGTLVSGEAAGGAAVFPLSPTLIDSGISFNTPSCRHLDADGLGLGSGYPIPVATFPGNSKRPFNSNVPQQQQRYPQQYSYQQSQLTQCPFSSPKPPALGIPSQVERDDINNTNNSFGNLRGGTQICVSSKMPDHFIYGGTPVSPMTGTGSHLKPNLSSDINVDANTAPSAHFPIPGGNYSRRAHISCHPQQQRGNSNYVYPNGIPSLLYEHYVETTQETWIEELDADASFDPSLYGNITCLVDSFSPRVPIAYNLELPFQDDVNLSSPRLKSTSSSDSIPSASSLINGDTNKVERQDPSALPHGRAEAVNSTVPVSNTESQSANGINSTIKNNFKKPMDGNSCSISHSHNTHHNDMESSSSESCPIPSSTSAKNVDNRGIDAGSVMDPDLVSPLRCYQDFEGPHFVEPIVSLASVWHSFNYPFGCLVPLYQSVILSNMRPPESKVVYTPLLSGFRIRFHDASAAYAKLLALKRREGNDRPNGKAGPHSLPFSPYGMIPSDSPGLLSWSASERPDNRNGVVEQVEELARANEAFRTLLTASTADVDHQSWVAIMWQPVFCGGHTAKQSCGTFLAFYMLRAPRHIFMPFTDKSSGTCINSSWDSPIFRVDNEILSFDIWSFKRRYHIGRCVPASLPVTSVSEARQVSVPKETPSVVRPTEIEGIEVTNPMDSLRDSPQFASAAAASGKDVRRSRMGNDVADLTRSPDLSDPYGPFSASAGFSTSQVRLPLIGLIFNRSRSDVWFCLSTPPSAETMSGAGSHPPPCPQRIYRAPLFLLVSALRLMSWNAFEENCRLKRFQLQKASRCDKEENTKQRRVDRNDVMSHTACGEDGGHTVIVPSEKDEDGEKSNKRRLMDIGTDAASMNCMQGEGWSSKTQFLHPVEISHSETVHNDGDHLPLNSYSDRFMHQKVHPQHTLSPLHVALPSYYIKGSELLVNAARHYRTLREAAMLDSSAEDAAGYTHVNVHSHLSPLAGGFELNKESPANGEGKGSGHSDLPLRVVAGGTNIELCGSSGSVILGLLDFYQWAQHDASITDLTERYCVGFDRKGRAYRKNGKHLEPR
ncbi:unnamed protein product [Phytomonas sp. Hart1]|nr:unnamed protein product [Phytomonas sp. Hart1]|eukprot:CCW70706.1 unnamed protein product [Phytomonas sp. isolate Hart1]